MGHSPRAPIILTNVSCAESRSEAREVAVRYLGEKCDSIDNHYHFSDGHLADVKGYESYGKMAKTYAKMKDPAYRSKATDFYVSIQVQGTPDDCIQQIAELRRLTGIEHLVAEFSFGSMPHHLAELNMRLFAEQVLPVLQRDAAFAGSVEAAPLEPSDGQERLFAPA
jgi:alkanesulfonate monooxygenase SsuD/methylene tetrahydromethanopterin reductase-like flavin-dependent oxidoreductase (luciferase family)